MLRLYMPQDEYWLASFEVIPPPKKTLAFPRPKNWKFKFPIENCCFYSRLEVIRYAK